MELTEFFKSYIETEEEPITICSTDYHILYINKAAAAEYERFGGYNIIGKSLNTFLDLEAQSKVNMVVEWFKESKENNQVFAVRYNSSSTDTYISALRSNSGELIGFCNKRRCRTPDETEPYALV